MELSQAQLTAIDSLTSGQTVKQAAHDAGVHRATVHVWLNDAAFTTELDTRKRLVRAAVDARLHGLADDAIDALMNAVRGRRTPNARVRAAQDILNRLERSDIRDIATRLLNTPPDDPNAT